jgi:hypothetical protein
LTDDRFRAIFEFFFPTLPPLVLSPLAARFTFRILAKVKIHEKK